MIQLTIITIIIAVAVAMVLFKVYHFGLMAVLNHFNLNIDELKNYPKNDTIKMVDHVAQLLIFILVIWKVFYT